MSFVNSAVWRPLLVSALTIFLCLLTSHVAAGANDEPSDTMFYNEDNVCCKVEMPKKAIFDFDGSFLRFVEQPCPTELKVCCREHINIVGNCIPIKQATIMLPIWMKEMAISGITLQEAIAKIGLVPFN